jgi:hypothetical protein
MIKTRWRRTMMRETSDEKSYGLEKTCQEASPALFVEGGLFVVFGVLVSCLDKDNSFSGTANALFYTGSVLMAPFALRLGYKGIRLGCDGLYKGVRLGCGGLNYLYSKCSVLCRGSASSALNVPLMKFHSEDEGIESFS